MNINKIRRLVIQERVTLRFTDHAIIEARKDNLTVEDWKTTASMENLLRTMVYEHCFLISLRMVSYPVISCENTSLAQRKWSALQLTCPMHKNGNQIGKNANEKNAGKALPTRMSWPATS